MSYVARASLSAGTCSSVQDVAPEGISCTVTREQTKKAVYEFVHGTFPDTSVDPLPAEICHTTQSTEALLCSLGSAVDVDDPMTPSGNVPRLASSASFVFRKENGCSNMVAEASVRTKDAILSRCAMESQERLAASTASRSALHQQPSNTTTLPKKPTPLGITFSSGSLSKVMALYSTEETIGSARSVQTPRGVQTPRTPRPTPGGMGSRLRASTLGLKLDPTEGVHASFKGASLCRSICQSLESSTRSSKAGFAVFTPKATAEATTSQSRMGRHLAHARQVDREVTLARQSHCLGSSGSLGLTESVDSSEEKTLDREIDAQYGCKLTLEQVQAAKTALRRKRAGMKAEVTRRAILLRSDVLEGSVEA